MTLQNVYDLIFCVALCALPAVLCVLHERRSPLVSGTKRVLIACGVVSLIGWALCASCLWVDIHVFDDYPDNGFVVACAYLFGWAYVWFFAIPISVIYGLLRGVCAVVERVSGKRGKNHLPVWAVVVFVLISVVALPVLMCLNPQFWWHEWGGKDYRLQVRDRVFHVQIRDADGEVSDIDTGASTFEKFHFAPTSDDELTMRCGTNLFKIVRRDGKWGCFPSCAATRFGINYRRLPGTLE